MEDNVTVLKAKAKRLRKRVKHQRDWSHSIQNQYEGHWLLDMYFHWWSKEGS